MNIFRAAVGLIATGAAIFTALSSYVIATQASAPTRAYALGIPPAARVQGNVANFTYGVRQLKDPKTAVTSRELELARQSYRGEPLSTGALSLIILSMTDPSRVRTRDTLLELGGELTRRNPLLNAELIKSAAQKGDDKVFFSWLSRSVLTNNDLRNAYVGAMAQATAKDGAVEALTPIIGPSPVWADYYWKRVVQFRPSLANAAKLRIAVARAPWKQTEITPTDKVLSLGLVGGGQFDDAYRLAQSLARPDAPKGATTSLLVNSSFARQPQLPPFDWQLAATGALGSSIDEKDKSLLISAIGGARGIAASQLVRLAPGNYVLNWSLAADAPISSGALLTAIYCVEPGVKSVPPLPVPLVAGNKSATVAIADGACRWHRISINVALPDDSAGIDAYFRHLSLAPAAKDDVKPGAASRDEAVARANSD